MRLDGSGAGTNLVESEIPRPAAEVGEVLIKVHAVGVTPTELGWYPTTHSKSGEVRVGAVPGHEFSGVVAEVGAGVVDWAVGGEVYGMNDWFADGALAEYCVTRPEWIAAKPKSMSHEEAATVPIGALTAWQGLFERAGLQTAERVLVHGGAGAVGVFAIQLARARGAHVIATASAKNLEFVKELGAAEALDYRGKPFEEVVRDIDVVFDGVGGETLLRSWGVLKPGGRMVTIAADGERAQDDRTTQAFFIVEPRRTELEEIARRIDAGELRTVVDRVVGWTDAPDIFEGRRERGGRGKVAVHVV
ncbi:MAG: NADP-dependent oxidoreductase [Acidobacteriota bacterium]